MKDVSKNFVRHMEIDEAAAGQRLDNFLIRHCKGVPQSHIYRIVRSGEVRVNGGRVRPSTHLALGDTVRIPPLRLPPEESSRPPVPRHAKPLPVLYEDDALLAVDKPAGLAVHGGSGLAFGVIEQLREQLRPPERPGPRFLELAHRLDRETSGVLLLARKRSALTALHAAWRDGKVEKRYDVMVRGRWPDARRKVALPLLRYLTADEERRVRVAAEGQDAVTVFHRQRVWRRLESSRFEAALSLLEAELHTGRTHQIRVHLTHLGFPLAGDDKYGDFAWNRTLAKVGLRRMFLHARLLAFRHPLSGEAIRIEAPLPPDLQAFLAALDAAEGAAATNMATGPLPAIHKSGQKKKDNE